jgi:Ras-related protein Rab-7A
MVHQPDSFPFMVVGNKLDLSQDGRLVSTNAGNVFCRENGGMMFIETSAKENRNIDTAFT